MQYRVMAYKCKVNSVLDLADDMVPLGAFYDPPDLYVICLEPLEEKKLPEEGTDKETKEVSESEEE